MALAVLTNCGSSPSLSRAPVLTDTPAQPSNGASAGTSKTCTSTGGRRTAKSALPPPALHPANPAQYSFSMVTFAGVPYPLTKVSMLLFYLRLCQRPTFRKSCYCTIAYIVCSATAVTLVGIFSCTPIRAGWDHDPALHARCIDAGTYLYAYQGVNIATDVLLMALPIPIIMRLQMRPKAKWGLVAMFTVGILCVVPGGAGVWAES